MKIGFTHYRLPKMENPPRKGMPWLPELKVYNQSHPTFEPAHNGGATICRILDDEGNIIEGFALCSYADNFCYKRGRDISLGRALKLLSMMEFDENP